MPRIKAAGLTGTLTRRPDSPVWRLDYADPLTGERVRVTTKQRNLDLAKARAQTMLMDVFLGARNPKDSASAGITVGGAVDHYDKTSTLPSKRDNVNKLFRFLRDATGEQDRDRLRDMPLAILDAALVSAYVKRSRLAPTTKRNTLAGARAVFCRNLEWEGVTLPDLRAFRDATRGTGIRVHLDAFVPIPHDVLDVMEARSKAAGGGIRRAFLLARYLGLGPKEIAACHRGWIREQDGQHVLLIVQRPDEGFTLKSGSRRQRCIVLPPNVSKELLEATGYMVPGNTPYMRRNWLARAMSLWLREFMPSRRDTLYALRKQAGSDLLNATGRLATVSRFLGHTNSRTTERHYATSSERVDLAGVWLHNT